MAAKVNGFTVLPYGSPALGVFKITGTSIALSTRREVAPLMVAYARDFHLTVESLHPGWCWGHAYKPIEGSDEWSNHAWGGAYDLNAPAHPMGKRNTFTPGERKAVDRLIAKYTFEGVKLFRCGKDYVRRPDDMHHELIAPRDVVLGAVKALQTPAKPKPKPAKPDVEHEPGSRVLEVADPIMSGDDVAFLQRFLGTDWVGPVDEDYGPRTAGGVRRYQRMRGIKVDGECGEVTWSHVLGRKVRIP